MKRICFILFIALLYINSAVAGEINYYNQSWAEILKKAAAENKYVFIDCYTDWCGWCKVMDKETMVKDEIVSFVNDKFIAVKMDMEHGEGIKIAMKYHITGFPSFMFFDPHGNFVYKSIGYQKSAEFAAELKSALKSSSQIKATGYSSSIDLDYPQFYKNAYGERSKKEAPKKDEVTTYLDAQKDLFSEVNWAVLSRFILNEKYNSFFLANIEKYSRLYGKGSTDDKVNAILYNELTEASKNKDEKRFTNVLAMTDKYTTDGADKKVGFKISYYKATAEWDKCAVAINDLIKKDGYKDADYINSLCWDMYEHCEDKATLQKAAGWMKQVIANEPKYAAMDTYAALLYKTGQLKEAKIWAEKAIAEGKKTGDDTTATETLLGKINR